MGITMKVNTGMARQLVMENLFMPMAMSMKANLKVIELMVMEHSPKNRMV